MGGHRGSSLQVFSVTIFMFIEHTFHISLHGHWGLTRVEHAHRALPHAQQEPGTVPGCLLLQGWRHGCPAKLCQVPMGQQPPCTQHVTCTEQLSSLLILHYVLSLLIWDVLASVATASTPPALVCGPCLLGSL